MSRSCPRGHVLGRCENVAQLVAMQGNGMYQGGFCCNVCGEASHFPVLHCNSCYYDLCASCMQLPEYCAALRCSCGSLYMQKTQSQAPSYHCHWNVCRGREVREWPALQCPTCSRYMCTRCSLIIEELQYLNNIITTKRAELQPTQYHPPTGFIGHVKIAMFGQTGVGKSSFINTCARSVRNVDTVNEAVLQSSGGEGTTILMELLQEYPWHLLDTRGFFANDAAENSEFVRIMEGHIQHGQVITRAFESPTSATPPTVPLLPVPRRAHAAIFVVSAKDDRLTNGIHERNLDGPKRYLAAHGMRPITVITHDDLLRTAAERLQAFQMATRCTGSTRENTFFVANYTDTHMKRDPRTERQALLAVHAALSVATEYIAQELAKPPVVATTQADRIVVEVKRGPQVSKHNCGRWSTVTELLRAISHRFPGSEAMTLSHQGTSLSPTALVVNYVPRTFTLS
ncbi:Interferon-induced protein 44 [Pelomyxa schiedti]|nr:Interferon-induced protein 44 [Pelomyxa schiedti]